MIAEAMAGTVGSSTKIRSPPQVNVQIFKFRRPVWGELLLETCTHRVSDARVAARHRRTDDRYRRSCRNYSCGPRAKDLSSDCRLSRVLHFADGKTGRSVQQ